MTLLCVVYLFSSYIINGKRDAFEFERKEFDTDDVPDCVTWAKDLIANSEHGGFYDVFELFPVLVHATVKGLED